MATTLVAQPSAQLTSGTMAVGQQLAVLSNGNYVVVYNQYDIDGSPGNGVFAQIFDKSGQRLGGPTQINTYTPGDQSLSAITAMTDGGYLISWTSYDQDGSSGGIYAQRYDASNATVGSEVHISTSTSGNQYHPGIAAVSGGGYVITWGSDQGVSDFDVFMQRFSSTGVALGSETKVNTTTANQQYVPVVAPLSGGGYVVTWQSMQTGLGGSAAEIYSQQYDASGNKVGGEVVVTGGLTDTMRGDPAVTGLSDGGYIISWSEAPQGQNYGSNILSQRFDSSGAKQGSVALVNSTGGQISHAAISAFADGSYIVAWTNYPGVIYQLYDATGTKVGSEVQLADSTGSGSGQAPELATWADGSFVVSWIKQADINFSVFTTAYISALAGTTGPDSLIGTIGDDYITGLAGNDIIQGNDGKDHLYGDTGNDQLIGGSADDYLFGQDGDDVLWGETGNDNLIGDSGNDILFGQDGNDTLWSGAGNDQLYGGNGDDTLFAQGGNGQLYGGAGDDVIYGLSTQNTFYGEAGNDIIDNTRGFLSVLMGGDGNDTLYAGAFGDVLFGEAGDDILIGNNSTSATDQLYGQDGNDVLFGQNGNDLLKGGAGDDRLYGQGQDDTLEGEAGTDWLDGGSGNDTLSGGDGADYLMGGLGRDNFYYNDKSGLADYILDFSHTEGDRFVLKASAFNVPAGFGLTDNVGLLQGAGVVPTAATATFYFDTNTKALWFDADGTGPEGAHVLAFLLNTPTLAASDFIFV
jgi:Ca2+-binding RTX toxin-like protein